MQEKKNFLQKSDSFKLAIDILQIDKVFSKVFLTSKAKFPCHNNFGNESIY